MKVIQQHKTGDSCEKPEQEILESCKKGIVRQKLSENPHQIEKSRSAETAAEKCQKRTGLKNDKICHQRKILEKTEAEVTGCLISV